MTLNVTLETKRCALSEIAERRIRHRFAALGHRLAHFPDPRAVAVLEDHPQQRRVTAGVRVALGPHAGHLISHQAGATADQAIRLAVQDVLRQLERRLATQRGEQTYGVPSRRLPAPLRPHPRIIRRGSSGRAES